MDVELLVIAECPHTAAALELLRQALAELGVPGQPVRTTIITDDALARERKEKST